ncbi:hypothetical protein ACEQ8H_001919 [Pleosporales sp. CAS-2024a]
MVNAKNYAFKVHPQQPNSRASTQAHGTVINCRRPGGKRSARDAKGVQSHHVLLDAGLKRKRTHAQEEDGSVPHASTTSASPHLVEPGTRAATTPDRSVGPQRLLPLKMPRAKKTKLPSKGLDLDCWFTILSFSDPAQLLEMRRTIPSCFHFLRDNPALWKHSRNYHYGDDLPEPCSELTEFQYADLRHDHGCQSCKTPNTRKTYWAFLRRWCKDCLKKNFVREHEAMAMLRGSLHEDLSFLHTCLPAGIFDSWGNFVGVGPATTHALKTIYLESDIKNLVKEYNDLRSRNTDPASWIAELHAWFDPKVKIIEERRAFAKDMESWEELMRSARSQDYTLKKAARKKYYQAKAAELEPAITASELESCPSYRRAIRIPKDPNSTSWLQLKPKLEKEAADLRAKNRASDERSATSSKSGTSTPMSIMSTTERPQSRPQQRYALPPIGRPLGYLPTQGLPMHPDDALFRPSPSHSHGLGLPRLPGIALPYTQGAGPSHRPTFPQMHAHALSQRHGQVLGSLQSPAHAASQSHTHASQGHTDGPHMLPRPNSHMF